MFLKRIRVVAGMVFALGAVPAFAVAPLPMVLVTSAQPIKHSYPGASVDILGISTGMTVDQVKAIFQKEFGVAPAERRMSIDNGVFATQSYVAWLSVSKPDSTDSIQVFFGTPATGNVAVSIMRTLIYQDVLKAPTLQSLSTLLDQKYGTESTTRTLAQPLRDWVFDKNGHITCPNNQCMPVGVNYLTGYDVGNPAPYLDAIARHQDLNIQSRFSYFNNDHTRASSLVISIVDSANMLLNSQETIKQLTAITDKAKQAPVAAPKL